MTAMPATQPMTAEEFLALPEREPGRPQNLVDGELVMTEATRRHQQIVLRLTVRLAVWVDSGADRGIVSPPIDVLLDERNVYAPDVLWYAPGRTLPDATTRPHPVPDLAVEVRSPSTWHYDIGAKKFNYERAGAQELWLVDTPACEVLVFRRSRSDAPTFDVALQLAASEALTSPLLSGFALAIDDLFAD